MTSFEKLHQDAIVGKVTTFDRMIFKGHLRGFYPNGAFPVFLWKQGVLLKDFAAYVKKATQQVKAHVQALAADAGRPFCYLQSSHTHASGCSKEDLARKIALEDGITEGLVAVFSVLEPCMSFDVRGNREAKRLHVVRRKRKCLHFYLYFIDPEFGWMHVRLQSWFPFEIQIYINGREWLSRQLEERDIAYQRYDNTFTQIDDIEAVAQLCEKFAHRTWPRVLNAFARRINPLLPVIERLGFGEYYWCLDQCEIATDVMFEDRATLEALMPDLYDHAIRSFSAEDVLRFLGRKGLHHAFKGEVTTDQKRRIEGYRVKHRVKQNSIKMYDKASVLRIETTINNPRDFRVLKTEETSDGTTSRRWRPMGKGVANIWRYVQVGTQANARYLEALAPAQRKGEVVELLDDLCQSRTVDGTRYARLQPVSAKDCELFAAVMAGENLINGLRNRDVRHRLYDSPARSAKQRRSRSARVSRLIRKLRGHGLLKKVRCSHLYRVTKKGYQAMAAALRIRGLDYPAAHAEVFM